MSKIIAKEVAPESIDFSFYFDDDGLTEASGENCACYIVPPSSHHKGFNEKEYKYIQDQAEAIIECFDGISKRYSDCGTYKQVMEDNNIKYTSHKCHLLKEWAKNVDIDDTDDIAEFLTITTGEEWSSRSFCGYSQGDYCEVVYCTAHYTEEHVTEIGKFWLGCGTEFCINNCYGYFVTDDVRWREGVELRNVLAEMYGCKSEEIEVHLYAGEHRVSDYKLMEVV